MQQKVKKEEKTVKIKKKKNTDTSTHKNYTRKEMGVLDAPPQEDTNPCLPGLGYCFIPKIVNQVGGKSDTEELDSLKLSSIDFSSHFSLSH